MFARLTAATALATSLFVGTAQAETLRFSSFEPPQGFVTGTIFAQWMDNVAEASGGDVTVQMFAGGTLGRSPAQQLQLVEDGVADLAFIVPGYNPGVFPGLAVAELPYTVTSAEAGSRAIWQMFEQGLLAGEFDRFKIIGLFATAPQTIATVGDVQMPEDIQGMNLRASSPMLLASIESIGAVAIGGITAPTIAESISRGVVAGSFNEWNALRSFRIEEAIDHVLEVPMGTSPLMVVMNRSRFEALTPEQQAAIDSVSGAAFAELFGVAFDGINNQYRDEAIAEGRITITVPTQEQLDAWRVATRPSIDAWLAEDDGNQALYDAYLAAMAE